ncbi:MAG: protease modulator HflC [Deltaproteobacteria bacterium]|nr:protease modulator HflC [Deltaproteobacteria bacterium]
MVKGGLAAVIVIAVLIVVSSAVFIVDETQQVVITQFGRPVGKPIKNPGVHFKMPFVQEAHFFDKRFLEWNGDPNQVPTKDKRFILVDTYARWRISQPLLFFQRLRDERGGQSRLDDIIDGETRNAVASHNLVEIVRSTNREVQIDPDLAKEEQITRLGEVKSGRAGIMALILTQVQKRTSDLGIEVVDMRFKRINYNETVRATVYERMIAERKRIAERFRSEGLGDSARIRGEKERELESITSDAYRKSQAIVGRADAEATPIYADAYGRDPNFYKFFKTIETYPKTLDKNDWLILSTEGEFFEFLQRAK